MNPTNKLRWYSPLVGTYAGSGHPLEGARVWGEPILQQWWAVFRNGQETPEGEWRAVPSVAQGVNGDTP